MKSYLHPSVSSDLFGFLWYAQQSWFDCHAMTESAVSTILKLGMIHSVSK